MRRSHWTALATAVLIFLCGVAAGVLAHRYYLNTTVSAKTAEDWRVHYVSEMRSRLHLDDAQVGALNRVMDETKSKYREVRERTRPDILRIKTEHIRGVEAILRPDQVPEYRRMIAERERRAGEPDGPPHRHHRPGPPGEFPGRQAVPGLGIR